MIGVIPQRLVDHEIAHRGLTELRIVPDMHERKAQMAALADGFVALPGAAGTLEELFEVWTWGQLGLHLKPCGLLDVAGYYTKLREFLDHMVTEKFLVPRHRQMLTVQSDPLRLLEEFASYQAPAQKDALSRDALPPVDSLAWLHVRDRRLLMVRSRGRKLFYLPGGKREPGESDVQALTREIAEELGVSLHPDSFRFNGEIDAMADGFDDGRRARMVCYEARHTGDPAPGREIEEFTWTSTADLDRCPPAARLVLARLHDQDVID